MAEALSKITLGDSHVRASEGSSIGMLGRVLLSYIAEIDSMFLSAI